MQMESQWEYCVGVGVLHLFLYPFQFHIILYIRENIFHPIKFSNRTFMYLICLFLKMSFFVLCTYLPSSIIMWLVWRNTIFFDKRKYSIKFSVDDATAPTTVAPTNALKLYSFYHLVIYTPEWQKRGVHHIIYIPPKYFLSQWVLKWCWRHNNNISFSFFLFCI